MDPMKNEKVDAPVRRAPRRLPGGGEELSDDQLETIVGGMTQKVGAFGSLSSTTAPTSSPVPIPYPNIK